MKLKALLRTGFGLQTAGRRLRESLIRPASRRLALLESRLNQFDGDGTAPTAAAGTEAPRDWSSRLERLETEHADLLRQTAMLSALLIGEASRDLPLAADPAGTPAFTIILPTYNRAAFVVEAVRSVIAQTFAAWELVIVDDGSTDGTAAALAGFLADGRIRYLRQDHAGSAPARKLAFAEARGTYVAFLDSDNLYFPGFLAAARRFFQAEPQVKVAYGGLVTDHHGVPGRILMKAFDRTALLGSNYVDMSTIVVERRALDESGIMNEFGERLPDWEIMLKLTETAPAGMIPALAAIYRRVDDLRLSERVPVGPSYLDVRARYTPAPKLDRPLRVLYVLWHYPQLSESYIETEILQMLKWGVEIAVWCETDGASPYPIHVRVYRGTLDEAVRDFRPAIVHVHWLTMIAQVQGLSADVAVTVRAHGFETHGEALKRALEHPRLKRVYCFPHQTGLLGRTGEKLRPVRSVFDPDLFYPGEKDTRLVVRTSAALPSKDLGLFLQMANRFPDHRFVLAAVTCKNAEHRVKELLDLAKQIGTRAEIRVDLPREETGALMRGAGIYLHTAVPTGQPGATPFGMPISISEAMATGAFAIVRNEPALAGYVADAGAVYDNADQAADIIADTVRWTPEEWRTAQHKAIDRAYILHSSELELRALLDDWLEFSRARPSEDAAA